MVVMKNRNEMVLYGSCVSEVAGFLLDRKV